MSITDFMDEGTEVFIVHAGFDGVMDDIESEVAA